MTETVDPLQELINEVRDIRQAFEEGISAVLATSAEVTRLRTDLTRTDSRATKRARWFRGLWAVLAIASVTFFVVDRIGAYQAARRQDCFQQWANATAHRTEVLNQQNSARISTLNRCWTCARVTARIRRS